ncbi:MAG: alpha/beta fold hydrolase [Anaerolineae bacterium]|nr:alpha/beta fold hydrolase [Anaerolineae bacterium]
MQRLSSFSLAALLIAILSLSFALPAAPVTSTTIAYAQGYTPTIEWDECPFALPEKELNTGTIECGWMIVPQQRSDPNGPQVELAFAILAATGANPAPDPIIYLEGGPGGSGLSGIDAWYDSPLRQDRDIIVLDQRGTGYSYPFLGCYEMDEIDVADDASDAEYQAAELDALQECADRLEAEDAVDLTAYTSAHNAADVADLRVALGYDEWNMLGISYGTRLALTIMRDYPQGIRSVILDSTYPPVVDAFEEQAFNTQRVFEIVFNDCAADAACNSTYPNLEQRFYALVDRLNASPVYIADWEEDLTGNGLVDTVFDWLYNTRLIPYIPLVINDIEQGRYDMLVTLDDGVLPGEVIPADSVYDFVDEVYWLLEEASDDVYDDFFDEAYYLIVDDGDWDGFVELLYGSFYEEDADYLLDLLDAMSDYDLYRLSYELFYEDLSDADGMYNAVECNEELPFNSYDEGVAYSANVPVQLRETNMLEFEDMIATCALWKSGTADPVEDLAVTSAIPTFIGAGQYDPITPPEWGVIASQTLPNSYYFEYPAVGHGVIDGGFCPESMMRAFLNNPTVAPDASCINSMGAPAFAVR